MFREGEIREEVGRMGGEGGGCLVCLYHFITPSHPPSFNQLIPSTIFLISALSYHNIFSCIHPTLFLSALSPILISYSHIIFSYHILMSYSLTCLACSGEGGADPKSVQWVPETQRRERKVSQPTPLHLSQHTLRCSLFYDNLIDRSCLWQLLDAELYFQ